MRTGVGGGCMCHSRRAAGNRVLFRCVCLAAVRLVLMSAASTAPLTLMVEVIVINSHLGI